MSSLLLDSPLLCYHPALVRRLGLADAAVVQQLHYWAQRSTNEHDGEQWVYKTYVDWADEIGITSKAVRGALDRLRTAGVVVALPSPADTRDRTLWWRIDHVVLRSQPGSPSAPGGSSNSPEGEVPSAPGGSSITRVPDAVQRLQTETTNRESAPAKIHYDGRLVKAEVVEAANALLAVFNDVGGRHLAARKATGQASEHLRQIVGALLANPTATFDDWEAGMRRVLASPPSWTDGAPAQLGDIFGPRAASRTLSKPTANRPATQRATTYANAGDLSRFDKGEV